jgi:hypothetical protein
MDDLLFNKIEPYIQRRAMENRGSIQNNRVILQGKRDAFSAARYGRDAAGHGKNHRIQSNPPDGLFHRSQVKNF